MTEQDVVNSQAFKAINVLIDEKANELSTYILSLRSNVDHLFRQHAHRPSVRVRIHDEDPDNGGREHQLAAHVHEIESLDFTINCIKRLHHEIGELQSFKCRLTGDWDFTKGDTTDMVAVFGEKLEGF